MNNSIKKGFTLVELLVVIAIIGILASIIVVSVSSARVKARDARRKADLTQVTAAIQLYYADNHAYPAPAGATGDLRFKNIAGPSCTGSNCLLTNKYLSAGFNNPYPTGFTSNLYFYSIISSDYYLYFPPETKQTATCGVCSEALSQCTVGGTTYDCLYLIKTGQETTTP